MVLVATCLILLKLLAHKATADDPKNVRVALETVLDLNDKDNSKNVKFIDEFQTFLTRVKKTFVDISGRSNKLPERRNLGSSSDLKFSDFTVELIRALKTYNDEDLEDVFAVVDDEVRKYHYKGCKFYELVSDHRVRRYVAAKLESVKDKPAKIIREYLDIAMHLIENAKLNSKQSLLLDYIDSLYTQRDIKTFKTVLRHFEIYKSNSKRANMDLMKMVRDSIRNVIFDHFTKLNTNIRNDFKTILNKYISHKEYTPKDVPYSKSTRYSESIPNKYNKNKPSKTKSIKLKLNNEWEIVAQNKQQFKPYVSIGRDVGFQTDNNQPEGDSESKDAVSSDKLNIADEHVSESRDRTDSTDDSKDITNPEADLVYSKENYSTKNSLVPYYMDVNNEKTNSIKSKYNKQNLLSSNKYSIDRINTLWPEKITTPKHLRNRDKDQKGAYFDNSNTQVVQVTEMASDLRMALIDDDYNNYSPKIHRDKISTNKQSTSTRKQQESYEKSKRIKPTKTVTKIPKMLSPPEISSEETVGVENVHTDKEKQKPERTDKKKKESSAEVIILETSIEISGNINKIPTDIEKQTSVKYHKKLKKTTKKEKLRTPKEIDSDKESKEDLHITDAKESKKNSKKHKTPKTSFKYVSATTKHMEKETSISEEEHFISGEENKQVWVKKPETVADMYPMIDDFGITNLMKSSKTLPKVRSTTHNPGKMEVHKNQKTKHKNVQSFETSSSEELTLKIPRKAYVSMRASHEILNKTPESIPNRRANENHDFTQSANSNTLISLDDNENHSLVSFNTTESFSNDILGANDLTTEYFSRYFWRSTLEHRATLKPFDTISKSTIQVYTNSAEPTRTTKVDDTTSNDASTIPRTVTQPTIATEDNINPTTRYNKINRRVNLDTLNNKLQFPWTTDSIEPISKFNVESIASNKQYVNNTVTKYKTINFTEYDNYMDANNMKKNMDNHTDSYSHVHSTTNLSNHKNDSDSKGPVLEVKLLL